MKLQLVVVERLLQVSGLTFEKVGVHFDRK